MKAFCFVHVAALVLTGSVSLGLYLHDHGASPGFAVALGAMLSGAGFLALCGLALDE